MNKLRTATCEICGERFTHYPSVDPGRFCSPQCHGVAKNPRMRRDLLTDSYLRKRYWTDGLTTRQIAAELLCSKGTIENAMRRLGIETRKDSGRVVGADGYVLIRMPEHPSADVLGYVREHRLVMERQIGRYLTPDEVVHHRNRDRGDNRPENLELLPNSRAHHRLHAAENPERFPAMGRRSAVAKRDRATQRFQRLTATPHYCACGCGETITLRPQHTRASIGVPRFKNGHSTAARKRAAAEAWLAITPALPCACGCGKPITPTRVHFRNGKYVPRFLHGHHRRKR